MGSHIRLISKTVIEFSKSVSRYKTPNVRTSGANESANQKRGEPDILDTIASLMLWRECANADLPTTYMLTARSGDETDIRIQKKGSERFIDINVKATKAPIARSLTSSEYGNVAVKAEELGVSFRSGKFLAANFRPVQIEDRAGAFWAISSDQVRLPEIFIKIFVHLVEDNAWHADGLEKANEECNREGQSARCSNPENHVHFCNWIYTGSAEFRACVNLFNAGVMSNETPLIPGIQHPGLWIDSKSSKRYSELIPFLKNYTLHDLGNGGTQVV